MRFGSIVGIKEGKVSPIDSGLSSEMLQKFRKGKFEAFQKICFFDSGGRVIKKTLPQKKQPIKDPVKDPGKLKK